MHYTVVRQDLEKPNGCENMLPENITKRFRFIGNIRKRNLFILGAVAVVLLVIGAWFFLFSAPGADTTDTAAHTIAADKPGQDQIAAMLRTTDDAFFADIMTLKSFEQLFLKNTSAMARVDMDIALELIDPDAREKLALMENRIYEIVQGQVRELTWLELRNPEGKIQLKYDLLKRINSLFSTPVVRNVFFTKFLMQ